jgi:hypothetical protein
MCPNSDSGSLGKQHAFALDLGLLARLLGEPSLRLHLDVHHDAEAARGQ